MPRQLPRCRGIFCAVPKDSRRRIEGFRRRYADENPASSSVSRTVVNAMEERFPAPTAMLQSTDPRNRQHFRPRLARTMPHLRQCGAIVAGRYTSIHLWGQEDVNAHATHFGNRDNWGWGVRGSAINGCAGVRRRSISLPYKSATRDRRRAHSGGAAGAAAKESEPPRAPNREGTSKAGTGGGTRRCPREVEQTGCAGAGGRAHLAERGGSRSRDGGLPRDGGRSRDGAAACGSISQ